MKPRPRPPKGPPQFTAAIGYDADRLRFVNEYVLAVLGYVPLLSLIDDVPTVVGWGLPSEGA